MVAGKAARRHGEAKNSWLTGTAAWNFVALSQWIAGVRAEYDGLRVEPRLPAHVKNATITRVYRGAKYVITVENKDPAGKIAVSVTSGGVKADGTLVAAAPKGATVTKVKLVDASVAWGHTITDYRSHTLADKTPGREFTVPLMWGSYAMNASAGLRNQKSNNLILLIEYRNPTRKWAAVPENLGGWPRDANLGNLVQYRHGGKKRVNIGFIDGHVERSGDKKKLSLRDSSWWHPPRPKGWVAEF
jgi:prepilin-type processing-associated H-X9-DG protein